MLPCKMIHLSLIQQVNSGTVQLAPFPPEAGPPHLARSFPKPMTECSLGSSFRGFLPVILKDSAHHQQTGGLCGVPGPWTAPTRPSWESVRGCPAQRIHFLSLRHTRGRRSVSSLNAHLETPDEATPPGDCPHLLKGSFITQHPTWTGIYNHWSSGLL